MIRVEKLTAEEKRKMYNKLTKKQLIEMLIANNEIIENMRPTVGLPDNNPSIGVVCNHRKYC